MKAITLWQPWASLIAIGAKPFETRGYPPPKALIGQRIAIHAAVRPVFLDCLSAEIWRAFADRVEGPLIAGPRAALGAGMPLGAVVCTAVLAAAYRCGEMDSAGQVCVTEAVSRGDDPVLIQSDSFGDYRPGRWAWLLTDIEALATPAPARGKQGWWTWSPNLHPAPALLSQQRSTAPGGSPALFLE